MTRSKATSTVASADDPTPPGAATIHGKARGTLSNAGWNAFATAWNIAISFLVTPVLIAHLGASDYGLLVLVWSVTGILGVANLGVGEATLRYVSHYLGDRDMSGVNRVFGSTLAFYLVVCSAVSLVVVSATGTVAGWINMPPEGRALASSLLRLSAALFALGMIGNAFRAIPMAVRRYDISSKIGFGQGVVRSVGFMALVVAGFGLLHVIVWEIVVATVTLGVQIVVARRLLPDLRPWPRVSIPGVKEIFGYGMYSFMTHVFLTLYRESGKLVLGRYLGPVSVAYLGAADNVAYRLYMVIVNSVETLMPRFSANRDPDFARTLVLKATEGALAASVVLLVPLAVLMPDLLRLWIDAEFAREGGTVGQLLAISFIGPAVFAPIATLYRGIGRPGFVTGVLAVVGAVAVLASIVLVPQIGIVGVGYGYIVASVAWLCGTLVGWLGLYGRDAARPMIRATAVPLVSAFATFGLQHEIRPLAGELGWAGMIGVGALFAAATAALLVAADRAIGGDTALNDAVNRLWHSAPIAAVLRHVDVRGTR